MCASACSALMDSIELGVIDPRDPDVKPRIEALREKNDTISPALAGKPGRKP